MYVCMCIVFSHGTMYANRKHNIQKGCEIHDTPILWNCVFHQIFRSVVRNNTEEVFHPWFPVPIGWFKTGEM